MMKLIKLENEQLAKEQIHGLKKICCWLNNEPDTDIYVLKDDDDIKSVFFMKRFGQAISTTKELDFGTKSAERKNGYLFKRLNLSIKKRDNLITFLIKKLYFLNKYDSF